MSVENDDDMGVIDLAGKRMWQEEWLYLGWAIIKCGCKRIKKDIKNYWKGMLQNIYVANDKFGKDKARNK